MAMSLAKSGGGGSRRGGRRRSRGRSGAISDINITPMVDVMLVLLIVFMVAAPLLTVGVPIDLPQSNAKDLNTEASPITISVTPDGEIYLGDNPVQLDGLIDAVKAESTNGTDDRVYVRGDASANYGTVMKVMGMLSGAGYSKIGLITQQEQGQ